MRKLRYNVEMPPSSEHGQVNREPWNEQILLHTIRDSADALVVTGNVRAARALRQRYNQWRHAAGRAGWPTPQILAWDSWLQNLWASAATFGIETRALLNNVQELELWRNIISQDEAAQRTFSVVGLAELAQSAWREMQRFRLSLRSLNSDGTQDTQAFARWAGEFEKLCRRLSFLSAPELETAVVGWLPTNQIALPNEIFLLGLDRVTPSQSALICALQANGCAVRLVELRPAEIGASAPAIVCARTQEEEIAVAAHWVRHALLADPKQRIGVLVPALAEMRDAIDAIFRRTLAPSSMDVRAAETALPYEFSLGTPMHRMADIRTALALLQWTKEPLPPEEISWLLVHGDFGTALNDEAATILGAKTERAKLDRRFRDRANQLGGPVSFSTFREWLLQLGNTAETAPLRRSIQRLFAAERDAPGRPHSFAAWRETFEEMLAAADWNLLKPTMSVGHQLLKRWNAMLDELSSLNAVTGPVKFDVALEKLRHLASHTLFSPESRNAPVQILGISESAGLTFDSIWWMKVRASAWPLRGNAQPFLPWHMQRTAHMPYADPVKDLAFALRVTERIVASASSSVISFAMEETDPSEASAHTPDREVVLSPLVRELFPAVPIAAVEEFLPDFSAMQQDCGTVDLEIVHDEPALPFQSTHVRGGVKFLELQAACPFRAFAELRLAARPVADFSAGLSSKDQGIVMHSALAGFWNQMQTQKNLLAKSGEDLRKELRHQVNRALTDFLKAAKDSWQSALLEIESDRLEARLLEWLEQEKKRAPFKVLATEDALKNAHLGGIEFDCRIDRIDQVAQGIVLLDYKSGEVQRNCCEGDRPDQPQLPAYAVLRSESNQAANHTLAGVAFAGLHPRKVEFTVVASLPSVFEMQDGTTNYNRSKFSFSNMLPEEIKVQQELWGATLIRLAKDFRAGTAVVDPKKGAATCRLCAQGPLCRIREMSIETKLTDEEEEDFS